MNTKGQHKLREKVAIVTGGSRGIGEAIAFGFAREGASLVVCGRTFSDLEKVCQQIQTLGTSAIPIKADVSEESQVEDMVEEVLEEYGKIDILVNNAGISPPRTLITETTKELWDQVIDINLTGLFLCSRAVVKHMLERKSGNIINISSGAGRRGGKASSLLYSSSKFGVEGFTYSLSKQLKPYGICVNALRPGPTDTDMHKDKPPEFRSKLRKPGDVSKLAVFLAQQTVGTMTGESIDIKEWEKSLQETV